jgi:hypothetical protein
MTFVLRPERRLVSAPNTNPDFGVTLIEASLDSDSTTKKRKNASELTPDNADEMLTRASIDFTKFYLAVSKNEMSEREMFAFLKECVIDPNVGDLHLGRIQVIIMLPDAILHHRSSHFQVSERDTSNRLELTSLIVSSYSNQR